MIRHEPAWQDGQNPQHRRHPLCQREATGFSGKPAAAEDQQGITDHIRQDVEFIQGEIQICEQHPPEYQLES